MAELAADFLYCHAEHIHVCFWHRDFGVVRSFAGPHVVTTSAVTEQPKLVPTMRDNDSYQAQRLERMQQNAAKLAELQARDCAIVMLGDNTATPCTSRLQPSSTS